jgi:hypothetical protein
MLDDKEHLVGPGTDISSLSASVATGGEQGQWTMVSFNKRSINAFTD